MNQEDMSKTVELELEHMLWTELAAHLVRAKHNVSVPRSFRSEDYRYVDIIRPGNDKQEISSLNNKVEMAGGSSVSRRRNRCMGALEGRGRKGSSYTRSVLHDSIASRGEKRRTTKRQTCRDSKHLE